MNDHTFMKPFKRIAIVSNATKTGANQVGAKLKEMAAEHGVEATLLTEFPAPSGLLRGWTPVLLLEEMVPCLM